MSELDVRIVEMEPMRVASAHGFGESPEEEAWKRILAFAESKGLDPRDARFFGFNNPSPSPGSPNYGYEQWMAVGADIAGEGEIVIKEIPARTYAVLRCEGLHVIGKRWQQLVTWFEDSAYRKPPHYHQCLEELLTAPDVPPDDFSFDLYLPIVE
jgi:DNA gyrase inhibitor GyrI